MIYTAIDLSQNAKIMQGLIPRANLYVYNGSHLGLMTNAKELAGVIEQFLTYNV